MSNFSIDLAAEDITDTRTKKHFREVLVTFSSGCHRSCVVTLWSVLVADLVYKLQDLRDLYGEPTAKSILDQVAATQAANPYDSKWESDLLDAVGQRLSLFGPGEHTQLQTLQKLRHLSAHPVLNNTEALFVPPKETVRSNIRLVLESTLLKPPVFSKKIISEFVVDLAAKKALLPDLGVLKPYIEARYGKSLTRPVEIELVRALWKFCFKTVNSDTDENRNINTRALVIVFERRLSENLAFLREHRDQMSDVAPGAPLDCLIVFLSRFPDAYQLLTEAATVLITQRCSESLELFARATYLSDTISSHIDKVADRLTTEPMSTDGFSRVVGLAEANGCLAAALAAGAAAYGRSGTFNVANQRFGAYVEPYLSKYQKADLELLLRHIEANGQTYGRGRASTDHAGVYQRCLAVDPTFDMESYSAFAEIVARGKGGTPA
jgi:hypothetical protein